MEQVFTSHWQISKNSQVTEGKLVLHVGPNEKLLLEVNKKIGDFILFLHP